MCPPPFSEPISIIVYIICIVLIILLGVFLSFKIIKETHIHNLIKIIATIIIFVVIIWILHLVSTPIMNIGKYCQNDVLAPDNSSILY